MGYLSGERLMPYIEIARRQGFQPELEPLLNFIAVSGEQVVKGDINYILTRIVMTWLNARGHNYNNMSDVKAVLTDARDEFARQVMNPYEDMKKEKNGTVYY